MDQTWLGRSGGFGPTSFPLFQENGAIAFLTWSVHCSSWPVSLVKGTDELAVAAAKPLIAVSFRAKLVELRWPELIDRDAIEPLRT
jgi:hypothetical protein